MFIGNRIARALVCGLALFAAACSSGGGDTAGTVSLSSAVQNLTLDPDGTTTVLTLSGTFDAVTTANIDSSGSQTAQNVTRAGNALTVTWDERVTPSHSVRITGVSGITQNWRAVTTTNNTPPTFTIDSATQTAGLGGDEIVLTFDGPNVVAATAEDPTNWNLVVNSNTLDLSLSTFDFDALAQSLTITLSPLANLHASFTLASTGVVSVADVAASTTPVVGAATGDLIAPSLVSAEQNLTEDEYGRVVDFTFDEAMDPISSVALARFSVASPNTATDVEQVDEDLLRVTFANPVIPGVHQVTLSGLQDAHGNELPDGPTAISQPSPVVNAYDGDPVAVTVENRGGDYISLTTIQAFDVESAENPAHWTLVVDGNPVTVADQTLSYDFLAKTLVIELDFDMQNGTAFTVTGNNVLEVDGQTFVEVFAGMVGGDDVEPEVTTVIQNRNTDPTGVTLQVTFSEVVDLTDAETEANYTLSDNGISVISASLLPNGSVVRLTLDSVALPGTVTLTVDGIADLAGNPMSAPQVGIPITSTDTTAPTITSATATAIEGVDNDTVTVVFDDDMVVTFVEDATNWSFESPVGNTIDVSACSISYSSVSRTVVLTLDVGGLDLLRDTDFSVELTSLQDIGGNAMIAGTFTGDVTFENDRPTVVSVWRDAVDTNELEVRFSEPCSNLEELYDAITNPGGTRYTLWDGLLELGVPIAATAVDDGLGVRLEFGFLVNLANTLTLYGVADLAGNYMFPAGNLAIAGEDVTTPSFDTGFSTFTTISGEYNDEIDFVFDVAMSPWGLTDPSNYTVTSGGALDLEGASFAFDGDRTVTVRFEAGSDVNLQTAALYDIEVNNVQSAQGVLRTVADTENGIAAGGDVVAPFVDVANVRIDPLDANSVLVFADEALDETAATNAAGYDYDFGTLATEAVLLSPRVVRVTFPVAVIPGFPIDLSVQDLAGNASGSFTRFIEPADAQVPLLTSVGGFSVPGVGGDYVEIQFNEPVDFSSGLDPVNYAITNGGNPVSLGGAEFSWDSTTLTVRIDLASGVALDPSAGISFTVSNVADWSGNAISAGGVTLGGLVTGDTSAPSVASSFVNRPIDGNGTTYDVLFDEDVDMTFAGDALNWSSSGAQSVLDVTVLDDDAVRVVLSAPLGGGEQLQLAGGLSDPAGNTAGALAFTPEG